MKLAHWLNGAALAATLGMFSATSQAAPLGGTADGLRATAGDHVMTQQIAWRRHCWRHRGVLHCRRGYRRYYNYYSDPYYDSGYYYGPSLGFYFGGGGHRHHGHFGHHGHHRR